MVEFCPVCDNVLLVKKKKDKPTKGKKNKKDLAAKKLLYCPGCGYEAPLDESHKDRYTLSMNLEHGEKDKTLIIQGSADGVKISEEEREAAEDFFTNEAGEE